MVTGVPVVGDRPRRRGAELDLRAARRPPAGDGGHADARVPHPRGCGCCRWRWRLRRRGDDLRRAVARRPRADDGVDRRAAGADRPGGGLRDPAAGPLRRGARARGSTREAAARRRPPRGAPDDRGRGARHRGRLPGAAAVAGPDGARLRAARDRRHRAGAGVRAHAPASRRSRASRARRRGRRTCRRCCRARARRCGRGARAPVPARARAPRSSGRCRRRSWWLRALVVAVAAAAVQQWWAWVDRRRVLLGPASRACSRSLPTALERPWRAIRARAAAGRSTTPSPRPRKVLGIALALAVLGLGAGHADRGGVGRARARAAGPASALRDVNKLEEATGVSGEIDVTVQRRDITDPAVIAVDDRASSTGVLTAHGYKAGDTCRQAKNPPELCPGAVAAPTCSGRPRQAGQTRRARCSTRCRRTSPRGWSRPTAGRANMAFGIRLMPLDRQKAVIDDIQRAPGPAAGRAGERGRPAGAGGRGERQARRPPWRRGADAGGRRSPACSSCCCVRAPASVEAADPADPDRAGHRLVVRSSCSAAAGSPLNPMSATLGALVIAISTEFSVLLSARYRQERDAAPATRRGRSSAPTRRPARPCWPRARRRSPASRR